MTLVTWPTFPQPTGDTEPIETFSWHWKAW